MRAASSAVWASALAATSVAHRPGPAINAASPASVGRRSLRQHVRFDAVSPQLERIRVASVDAAMLPSTNSTHPARSKPFRRGSRRSRCPLSGRVRQVLVTLGDHVRSGQTLLTVETPESSTLQSALRQAQADVMHRQAALAKAEADVSRVRDLLANRAVAQKEVHRGGNVARRSDGGSRASAGRPRTM